LKESPWIPDAERQHITLEALKSVAIYRAWTIHALHLRTTHVHAVISGETAPERILSDFKAYATRALRRAFSQIPRRRYWTDHGSTRYLWNEANLKAAIEYVLSGQGQKMACYPDAQSY
jgi:REP element-mobilizing transposase RayT